MVFQQNGRPTIVSVPDREESTAVSEHAAPTAHEAPSPAPAGTALATPEFDRQEVTMFGQDDGHAVTVIGKMLVGFFFYSFLVMAGVALWTLSRGGQVDSHAQPAEHAEETEE
jgi:hypothetical protein